jgi:hypothetical protein
VGSGKRLIFAAGEQRLSEWLEENARVTWIQCDRPWEVEEHLISTIHLPLNLEQNQRCGFHAVLTKLRRDAKSGAREVPILGR